MKTKYVFLIISQQKVSYRERGFWPHCGQCLKGGAVTCNIKDKQKEGSERENENTRGKDWKRHKRLLSCVFVCVFRSILFFGGFVFLLIKNAILLFLLWRDTLKIMALAYKGDSLAPLLSHYFIMLSVEG